jgi:hypothetical protein
MDQRDGGIGQRPETDKLEREFCVQPPQSPLRTHPSNRTARKHYRQLWWMIVMLVLVFWAMQKASNPKLYESFFKAIGVPLTPTKENRINE